MRYIFNALFRFYHIVISPLLGTNCRFAPSCSEYTRIAIEQHGPLKGSYLGVKRICRCHPWGGHGFDPVPGTDQEGMGETDKNHANSPISSAKVEQNKLNSKD